MTRSGVAPKTAAVVLVVMMVAALGLRMVHITDPPLNYQPGRQYHSLLIVRNYYLGNGGGHASVDQRAAAAGREPLIEPPVMELLTLLGWELAGRQVLWLGAALAAVIWVGGSVFVYALGRRLASRLAGLVAAAVFLFEPYVIVATRSFQPDPLMTVSIAAAALALIIDDERRTRRSLVIAGLVCGFAIFTKLVGVFYVLPLIGVLTVWRGGWRSLWSRRTVVLVVLALAPALLYAAYGTFVNPFIGKASEGRFVPSMLTTHYFWSQWWSYATLMVGVGPLLVAAAGLVISRGRARWVIGALVGGYIAYGISFTFLYANSVYYHLPIVLPVSIGVAVVVGAIERSLRGSREPSLVQVALATGVAVVILASLFFGGVPLEAPGVTANAYRRVVTDGSTIGRLVHHDTKVIILGPGDGDPMRYSALLAGSTWPDSSERYLLDTEGVRVPTDGEELRALSARLGGADYFVADVPTLAGQPQLRSYLDDHYTLVASDPLYRVYDLRRPLRA